MLHLVSEWAHRQEIYPLHYLDDGLIIADSVPHLLEYLELPLNLCKYLGLVVNWEKSDLELTNKAQYLRLLRHHPGESLSHGLLNCRIPERGGQLSPSFISLCKNVAADFWPHRLPGMVCFENQSQDAASSLAAGVALVSGHG